MHGINNVILISLFSELFPLFLFTSRAGPMEKLSFSRKESCKILVELYSVELYSVEYCAVYKNG
jgi:hypothetical protein